MPVVQIASAAPALAVSGGGGNCSLRITRFHIHRRKRDKTFPVRVVVKNTGNAASGQVSVVVRVPRTKTGAFSSPPHLKGNPNHGWTFAGRTGSGPWYFTFVSPTGAPPHQELPALFFVLKTKKWGHMPKNTTVIATANADRAVASSGSCSSDAAADEIR